MTTFSKCQCLDAMLMTILKHSKYENKIRTFERNLKDLKNGNNNLKHKKTVIS